MRFDVKEEILVLRSSIFRSMRSRHTQHHCHWATATKKNNRTGLYHDGHSNENVKN